VGISPNRNYVTKRSEPTLLVASLGDAPKNPTWYGNLVKHPDIEVRHRGRTARLRACVATDAERPSLWPICDEHFPPYAEYRSKTNREIPILVCEPSVGTSPSQ
jgi:deazaflavin-dependent oxidoreductase (nitroreductase family)